jgi:hypothetical protein
MAETRLPSTSGPGAVPLDRTRPMLMVPLILAALLVACDGDTLLEPDERERGPDVGVPGLEVALAVEVPDRFEITDSVRIQVTAMDPAGVTGMARVGYTAIVHLDGGATRQAFTEGSTIPQGPPGDTIVASFTLQPDWLTASGLPTSFDLEVYGWAFNRSGDCAAAVPELTTESFRCRTTDVNSRSFTVGDSRATSIPVLGVPGRTSFFPSSSMLVGDLQVDTLRGNVFVSNRQSNRLHVLRPDIHAWEEDVVVGSEPWGLHLNRTGDTLLVANSGGTSISHVSLQGSPREVVSRRLQTRNDVLFQLELEEDEVGDTIVASMQAFDFSDRPQFVAQDSQGRILYSTRPTMAAPLGTVRWVENQAAWAEPETRILARLGQQVVREELDVVVDEMSVAILNADSIHFFVDGRIEVFDHRTGFPEQILRSGIRLPLPALREITSQAGSNVVYLEDAAWELEAVSFADTTYVASSRDRNWVAFGDGGQVQTGRVVIWHAGTATISSRLSVVDLVNNSSERVRAIELNRDGSLGIARGAFGTYFFSRDLRLRGTVPEQELGGGGAALHPDHPDTPAPGASSAQTLAFTLTGDRMVRILDTVHYVERGRIPLRDAIAGPMRVTPPLPTDNGGQGRNCTGPDCVVAKLFAVTEGGGVVVVDIRGSHIQALP